MYTDYDPNQIFGIDGMTLVWIMLGVAVVFILIACVIIYSSPKDKVAKAFRTYVALRSINDESGKYAKDGFYMVSAVQNEVEVIFLKKYPKYQKVIDCTVVHVVDNAYKGRIKAKLKNGTIHKYTASIQSGWNGTLVDFKRVS